MRTIRRPSRAAVHRALRSWAVLARPPDPHKETAAGAENTEAAEGMARDKRNGNTEAPESVSDPAFVAPFDPCEVPR